MEAKEFEKFYSLCERTVSRQRLLGADDKDIAFVLTGMMATLPEDELTLTQHKKLVDLVVGKDDAEEHAVKAMTEEAFQLHLKRAKEAMLEEYGKDGSQTSKLMFLIGWVTAPVKQVYMPRQLKRIFALADET